MVAICVWSFQLFRSCIVPDTDKRKIADKTDPSGLWPWEASSAALRTRYAAHSGRSFPTRTAETNVLKPLSAAASHALPTPGGGVGNPTCARNHERHCGSVRKIVVQMIHR